MSSKLVNSRTSKLPRVSLCTNCMGRTHHLRRTIFRNIVGNCNYPNLEFVLLDYNSQDGMGDWVKSELAEYLESGLLVYYHYPSAVHYDSSHAKNMALRLGSGDIVCNVDADNFTGSGFALYLARILQDKDFAAGCWIFDNYCQIAGHDTGYAGRVALKKSVFMESRGLDEGMVGWGYDDLDYYNRLLAMGYAGKKISFRFLKSIPHGDEERSEHMEYKTIGREGAMIEKSSHHLNATRSIENIQSGNLRPNQHEFGAGVVYRNFMPEAIRVEELYQDAQYQTVQD